ncbi:MAG: hypothetical protein CM15mV143_020 [Caudoviricetes sp.]|nr:MAG: hypothetical protein CM15mV143_020 [Caudoviricetes sp.]
MKLIQDLGSIFLKSFENIDEPKKETPNPSNGAPVVEKGTEL